MTEQEMYENFARNLATLRKSKELSQRTLARLLNLSRYSMISYENCRAAPSAYALYQISVYLQIPMEKLLTSTILSGGE